MGLLRLQCTLCQGQYSTKQEWLGHLMEPQHQVPARQAIGSWQGKKWKGQALVVFSKQSVGADDRLIQYFSRDLGTFVTDFVWEPSRPKVAFIQFDSSKTVRKVMSPLNDQQVEVDGQMFQVKEAASYSDFEWEALLPVPVLLNCDSQMECSETEEDIPSKVEEGPCSSTSATNGDRNQIEFENTPTINDAAEEEVAGGTNEPEPGVSQSSQPSLGPIPGSGCAGEYFKGQLELIKRSVEIPDAPYQSVLKLLSLLQQVLSVKTPKPSLTDDENVSRAILIRSWCLKLKYNDPDNACEGDTNNPPFILMQRKLTNVNVTRNLVNTTCSNIYDQLCDPAKSEGLYRSVNHILPPGPKDNELFLNFSGNGLDEHLPPVKISGWVSLNLETQMWHLIKYLCTFDPRCQPLLSVIYYWAKVNSIRIGESKEGKSNFPDPFGISWLVILFLCRKGYLPTPATVLEHSRKSGSSPILRLCGSSSNVGFLEDPEFARAWCLQRPRSEAWKGSKEETFAAEVFGLAFDFFEFWGRQLGNGSWVIDSGTGDILRMKEVQNYTKRMSTMWSVKIMLNNAKKDPYRLHMTNPFSSSWRINMSSSTQPYLTMLKTRMMLKNFMYTYNVYKENDSAFHNLEFLKLFKI